ncbi:cupredoxin domain-containing protein [Vulcanimicrobium alpinum]|uniref:cupredoxin domain-containing protein n=1 Tax=Vulcanimicrobium alpinum TaxID=3016050 RepID=UPI00295E8369|nr:cupredoxin domain-containing protein [Vulcanimicrobium alpinum]
MRVLLAAALGAALLPVPVTAGTAPATTTVHIKDDAFVPKTLTVKPGATVTFVNDDDDAHTVTADDGSWDSEGLNQRQLWTRAFAKAGTVAYHCTVHPFMHGTIVVGSAAK